jgi:outer membrane lipoprotein SlyB
MTMRKRLVAASLAALFLASCATGTSGSYSASEVGQTVDTVRGQVVGSRPVAIKGEGSLIGAGAGGAAGAAGVSLVGGEGALAVLGALLGAGAGYLAQSGLGNRNGVEYVVELEDGRTITIAQASAAEEEQLPPGAPVLVQLGSRSSRVLRDPRPRDASVGAQPDRWIDPDGASSAHRPSGPGPASAPIGAAVPPPSAGQ